VVFGDGLVAAVALEYQQGGGVLLPKLQRKNVPLRLRKRPRLLRLKKLHVQPIWVNAVARRKPKLPPSAP
jgi:hypothetical protein